MNETCSEPQPRQLENFASKVRTDYYRIEAKFFGKRESEHMQEHPIVIHGPSDRWDRLLSIASRVFVWGTFALTLYILRSFFLLIFLTFVFAYIQSNGVERLTARIPNRNARVVLVALGLLGIIIALGVFLAPRVRAEAALLADKYPQYLQSFDMALWSLGERYPVLQSMVVHVDVPNGVQSAPIEPSISVAPSRSEDRIGFGGAEWSPQNSPSAAVAHTLFGLSDEAEGAQGIKQTIDAIRNISAGIISVVSAFLLSILFSFLIVLDLPKLAASARSLRGTKLGFVYDEMADNIRTFARTLGRALEAQLFIALLNTVLTGLGLTLLGLSSKMSFLLVIVFFGSFVPVAGVFFSSIPICLVPLQESGVQLMFGVIALITIVHMVEAYILNPRIYGHHMRMNPVIVLIILTIGGKLFGVWGLVLGVPVCTYIFSHAIRHYAEYEEESHLASDRT